MAIRNIYEKIINEIHIVRNVIALLIPFTF